MKIKSKNSPFFPSGLAENLFSMLDQCQRKVDNISPEQLLAEAKEHLEKAHQAHARNGVANVQVAQAIYDVFKIVVADWDNIPFQAQPWCKGMISYFTLRDDDVEVVNSCLIFADREDLCIKLGEVKELPPPGAEPTPRQLIKPKYSSTKVPLAPGMRVLCRDAEWLVTGVKNIDPASLETGRDTANQSIHCIGVDDLVRGHEAIFLTQLDEIIPVDPRNTKLIKDNSNGYKLSKLFLGAQLRQMPASGIKPELDGLGV
ncbi:MAG: hypothetical protein U9Q58_10445, partial [Pseudomonadota bacterium]|nr:hypothetical protein [Pseudomonadota bacterium]